MRNLNSIMLISIAGLSLCSCYKAKTLPTQQINTSENRQISKIKLNEVQNVATAACLCEQSGENKIGCWLKYEKLMIGVEKSTGVTACAPISTVGDCFLLDGKEVCVTTRYSINAVPGGRSLCRSDDARAADQAYNKAMLAFPDDPSAGHRAGIKALMLTLDRIKTGEKVVIDANSKGCV